MFFTIATTRSEKRQVIDYWEEIRKESEKIKDYYDKVNEDKYHIKFYERVTLNYYFNNKDVVRPDFIEPLPKK